MLGLGVGFYKLGGKEYFPWTPNTGGPPPKGWFKGDKIEAGEEGESGTPAIGWEDSSPTGNNLTQSSEDDRGTIDDGGLLFDGTQDHYNFDSNIVISAEEAFNGFFVIKLANVSQDTILGTGGNSNFLQILTNKKLKLKIGGVQELPTFASAQFSSDEKMILTIQREAGATGNLNIFKNGTLLTPTSQLDNAGAITFNSLGLRSSDQFFGGHIYEFILYDIEDLSTSRISRIHEYLKRKHSI
tara:strand:+ start:908 stop:1633 length:726 start_codon:yes stop_codon:yes gene_type:complete